MRKKSKKNSKTTPTMIENAPFENLFEIFDADARNNIIETMFRDRINLIEQYSRQEINSFQVSKILGIKGRIIASSNYIETCDQKKTEFQAGIKELSEEIKELRQAVELLQKRILKLDEIQKNYQEKVVVEIQPLDNFYEAEEYHQKYLEKNPQGYCHIGKCFFG